MANRFETNLTTLRQRLPPRLLKPTVGIVCGSGLSTLANSLRDVVIVPYADLEGFGTSTVLGHKSELAFGFVGEALGVKNVIITNAAGALNPALEVGTIVVIHDHMSLPLLTGLNPLLGPPTSPTHARFVPLSSAYSRPLRLLAFRAAHALSLPLSSLAEGTYAWVSGPTYETPAEGRFLRAAGADVVGMSTVPEVVAARDEGMGVLVLSLVTNKVVIPEGYASAREEVEAELVGHPIQRPTTPEVSHEEVLEVGKQKAEVMKALVAKIIETIPKA